MSPPAGSSVLLDTCAVIYVANGDPMRAAARAEILRAAVGNGVLVSPVSAWEIGLLGRANRRQSVQFLPDPKTWFDRLMAQSGVRLAPFTPEIAINSSNLPGSAHGDPADRLIIATARSLGVPIVTRDRHMLTYSRAGHVTAVAC